MMQHIVVFKFDEEKLAAEFPGNSLQEGVVELRKTVPGLLELNMTNKNIAPWEGYVDCSKGYTHALVSKHVDAAALKVYAEFPAHVALVKRFAKCWIEPPLRMELNVVEPKL